MATEDGTKEWVAVLQGDHGTVKIAYRSAVLLAKGLEEQTGAGWVAQRVYQRDRQTYAPTTADTTTKAALPQGDVP